MKWSILPPETPISLYYAVTENTENFLWPLKKVNISGTFVGEVTIVNRHDPSRWPGNRFFLTLHFSPLAKIYLGTDEKLWFRDMLHDIELTVNSLFSSWPSGRQKYIIKENLERNVEELNYRAYTLRQIVIVRNNIGISVERMAIYNAVKVDNLKRHLAKATSDSPNEAMILYSIDEIIEWGAALVAWEKQL